MRLPSDRAHVMLPPTHFPMGKARILAAIGLVVLGSACASVGPRNLNRDQIGCGNSIGDSWKDQMLGNIVRMRYLDMPVFMDVGQVVSGYTLETRVNGTLNFGPGSESLGASGTYRTGPPSRTHP